MHVDLLGIAIFPLVNVEPFYILPSHAGQCLFFLSFAKGVEYAVRLAWFCQFGTLEMVSQCSQLHFSCYKQDGTFFLHLRAICISFDEDYLSSLSIHFSVLCVFKIPTCCFIFQIFVPSFYHEEAFLKNFCIIKCVNLFIVSWFWVIIRDVSPLPGYTQIHSHFCASNYGFISYSEEDK